MAGHKGGKGLLIEREGDIDGAGDCAADHRVITDAEEAHHLDVSRNGGRACELGVTVHTTHGVGHTLGSPDD